MFNPNGIIIYQGPSMLDGAPIMVVATGLEDASDNTKTGALIQTWIIRSDIHPSEAVDTGQDSSICGGCPHRGTVVHLPNGKSKNKGRSCYVSVFQAPGNVYRTAGRGRYRVVEAAEARSLFAGRKVRLGSYGDPAAVPLQFWNEVLADVDARTGYTHQWRTCDVGYARHCMASCDSVRDFIDAQRMGYRTFRVRRAADPVRKGEVVCPASKEAGFKTVCAKCVACGGTSAKARAGIVIINHGTAAVRKSAERALDALAA